ncbi:MAG: hypothetical protein ACXW3D_10335 [Caulobacteraceae bacterium]
MDHQTHRLEGFARVVDQLLDSLLLSRTLLLNPRWSQIVVPEQYVSIDRLLAVRIGGVDRVSADINGEVQA